MYGILTNLEYDKHWIFKNYYYSLVNVYGEDNVTRVENINDLNNIKVLFIGDEHFMPNKYIWMNDNFINKCNELKIRVFIFNNEKIFNSMFPWNEDIQKNVNKFNYCDQIVYDVDDSDLMGVNVNKTYMSKYFLGGVNIATEKNDKIVFIGNFSNNTYDNRKTFLNEIKNRVDIDILQSDSNLTMDQYLNRISTYKYVLSPLGNGNFVPMRYYESLFVNSIPLQQSTDGIINKFQNEIINNRGIFFKDIDDLIEKLKSPVSSNTPYYMEDFIIEKVKPILDDRL
jgi:hypothetical protein